MNIKKIGEKVKILYNKNGDIMKIKRLIVSIAMIFLLTSCQELGGFFSSFLNNSSDSISSSTNTTSINQSITNPFNSKVKMLTELDSNDNDLDVTFLQMENANTYKQCGDSIYISIGNIDIVIDAGTKGIGTYSVVPFLQEQVEDKIIELVVVTHTDSDHLGGMVGNKVNGKNLGVFTIPEFEILNVIDCGYEPTTAMYQDYKELLNILIDNGTNYYKYEDMINDELTPNEFYLGKDCSLKILDSKMYDFSSSDTNDYSIPCLLQHGKIRYLLTGDCETKAEANLAKLNIGTVDLFKAGHHGSPTSNTEVFLDTINPKNVVICSSYENSYNLPKKNVIDLFVEKYTQNVYGTFINGNIHAVSNKEELSIWCEGYKDYYNNNGNIDEKTKTLIPIQDSYWYENVGVYA